MTAGKANIKPLSVDKQNSVGCKMESRKKNWKSKQAEELGMLRGRIADRPKGKLMLR